MKKSCLSGREIKRNKDENKTKEIGEFFHIFHPREIQGQKSMSLGRTFAFTSPNGFLIAWSQLLCVHGHCLLAGDSSHWETLGLRASKGTSTSSMSHLHILGSHHFSHGVAGNSEMAQFLEQQGMMVSQPNHHHTLRIAFQSPFEVQFCILLWAQLLDQYIWTSSSSCAQG